MNGRRLFVSIVISGSLLLSAGLIISLILFKDPGFQQNGSARRISADINDFITQKDLKYKRRDLTGRSREEQVRDLRAELREKTIGYNCSTIVRRGYPENPFRSSIRVQELIEIYNSVISKDKRECFRYEWSGIDSSGSRFVLIKPDSVTYLAFYPSDLDGGPRIFEQEITGALFGYSGDQYRFIEVDPASELLEEEREYQLRLYYSLIGDRDRQRVTVFY